MSLEYGVRVLHPHAPMLQKKKTVRPRARTVLLGVTCFTSCRRRALYLPRL